MRRQHIVRVRRRCVQAVRTYRAVRVGSGSAGGAA